MAAARQPQLSPRSNLSCLHRPWGLDTQLSRRRPNVCAALRLVGSSRRRPARRPARPRARPQPAPDLRPQPAPDLRPRPAQGSRPQPVPGSRQRHRRREWPTMRAGEEAGRRAHSTVHRLRSQWPRTAMAKVGRVAVTLPWAAATLLGKRVRLAQGRGARPPRVRRRPPSVEVHPRVKRPQRQRPSQRMGPAQCRRRRSQHRSKRSLHRSSRRRRWRRAIRRSLRTAQRSRHRRRAVGRQRQPQLHGSSTRRGRRGREMVNRASNDQNERRGLSFAQHPDRWTTMPLQLYTL